MCREANVRQLLPKMYKIYFGELYLDVEFLRDVALGIRPLYLIMYLIKHKLTLTIDNHMIYVRKNIIRFLRRTSDRCSLAREIAFRTH